MSRDTPAPPVSVDPGPRPAPGLGASTPTGVASSPAGSGRFGDGQARAAAKLEDTQPEQIGEDNTPSLFLRALTKVSSRAALERPVRQ
mmetsp:Transcript_49289/g.111893  ORF Transcript_49289/g.111893 Transcript_49289/m.111893 type:complete len:88 (+) Transcript_49289:1-264(+)